MIIGITGSSGSGKSYAAKFLAQQGFIHIDFDRLAREVSKPGSPCLKEIVSFFGGGVLNDDGTLNRKGLGEIVFNDESGLKKLNEITHKYILKEADKIIESSNGNILLDAPLLFEADLDKKCDCTIAVIADRDIQINRICKRDGITEEIAAARISKQRSNGFFKENCTYIIENNGSSDELENKIITLIKELDTND